MEESFDRLLHVLDAPPSTTKTGPDYINSPEKRRWDLEICAASRPLFTRLVVIGAGTMLLWDGKNPFFTQERIGKDGKPFPLCKMRTMKSARGMTASLGPSDPQAVPPGLFLRRRLIDELTQWWNVRRGQMSWCNARPLVRAEIFHDPVALREDGRQLTMQRVCGRRLFDRWWPAYTLGRPGLASTFKSELFVPGTEEYMIARAHANIEQADTASPEQDRDLMLAMAYRTLSAMKEGFV
ncbi:sugar transferase [Actinoallomurus sp. NPDC052308]|uniref:sugar transferase n=1 Tax=Actinoallomurus sp. NPDC052308 TaxID=3155530 RepID=UPI003423FE85